MFWSIRISLFGLVSTNVHVVSTNVHFVDGDVSCKSDEISLVNRAKLEIEIIIDTFCIIATFCSSITSIMKYLRC